MFTKQRHSEVCTADPAGKWDAALDEQQRAVLWVHEAAKLCNRPTTDQWDVSLAPAGSGPLQQ